MGIFGSACRWQAVGSGYLEVQEASRECVHRQRWISGGAGGKQGVCASSTVDIWRCRRQAGSVCIVNCGYLEVQEASRECVHRQRWISGGAGGKQGVCASSTVDIWRHRNDPVPGSCIPAFIGT